MKIEEIVVLVKLDDGTIRQVIASQERKKIALRVLTGEDGTLKVDSTIEELSFNKTANGHPK